MRPFIATYSLVSIFVLTACGAGPIRDVADAAAQNDSPKDMPPDGVVGDRWHCGELGLVCVGPLGIGQCIDDECTPRLGPGCLGLNAPTCNDYCETYELSCAPQACDGATVWGWNGNPEWADGMCSEGDRDTAIPLQVACDEPLEGLLLVYSCCCE